MIHYVLDASALIDLLTVAEPNGWLRRAVGRHGCAAPACIDLDAACLLGRLVDVGALDVTLMTGDARLESVPGHRARVHLVSGRG